MLYTYRVKSMAEEFNDLRQAADALRNAMQGLDEATKNSETGVKAFGKATAQGTKDITKGLAGFAMQVGKGDTSFKSLNSVVDIAANAMAGLARTIPFAGEGLAAGIKATAEASKFMLEQMDTTTKAFNDLGKVGALGAAGMKGLQQQFINSGLSLQTFQKQVGDNAIALARFKGMTSDGAEAFADIAGQLTKGGDNSLRALGLSAEQIGESVGAFVTQQTRLGRAQNMSNRELADGTKRYAIELDALQKVTGMSREAIQKQQDAALSESRFRASIHGLNEQQQKDMLALQTVMNSFGAGLGQGTRDLVSGAANTDAAGKLMADTGGAARDIIHRLKEGTIDQTQAQLEMQAAISRNLKAGKAYSEFADGTASLLGDFAEKADIEAARMVDGKLVKNAQNAQINRTDKLTQQTIEAQKNMEGLNREMNQLGFTFLPAASTAVQSMTGSMEKFVKYVNKTIGAALDEGTGVGRGVPGAPGSSSGAETGEGGGGAGGTPAAPGTPAEIQAARKSVASQQVKEQGTAGLKLKSAEAVAGGESTTPLMELAYMIQNSLGGDLKYFSGLNDTGRDANSKHKSGRALDVVLNDPTKYENVLGMIKGMEGVSFAQYEQKGQKNANGSVASGNHIHAEVKAARGAILSGPMSGYRPNLTMHGTEAIVPLNSSTANAAGLGTDPGVMMAQLEKMDEMISVLKSQLSVSTKLLAYSS
jgi:hypothetical protein